MDNDLNFSSTSSNNILYTKTPPIKSLNTKIKRSLSSSRRNSFKLNDDDNDILSPALKYDMDSTPSKKIKLRPLLSSNKKKNIDVVVMEATTKSFSALSTPNNLKFSTGRNNVKISSKKKSHRKPFGTLRGANNSSMKKKSHRKKARNVKPLTATKKSSLSSSKKTLKQPFYKQQQIFVNVPCGHLQNSRFKKCAENKCSHECCKRYFQLENISVTKAADTENIESVDHSVKQNIAKSTKKKPLPLVSKIVTPLSKSNRHGDEEEEEDESEFDNTEFQQAIRKSNTLYSQQKAKFDKLMKEHSEQTKGFHKLLSTPEHSVDRACKPGQNDNNELLYGNDNDDDYNEINESVESIDDDSGWESDDVPPPPPPPDNNDGDISIDLSSRTTATNIVPPKLDLNPVFDRIISNNNTSKNVNNNESIKQSYFNAKKGTNKNNNNTTLKIDILTKNYAKHFVAKLEAAVLEEGKEKNNMYGQKQQQSVSNNKDYEGKKQSESNHVSNKTPTRPMIPQPSINYNNNATIDSHSNNNNNNVAIQAPRSAPRSAKKRARIDSSYTINFNNKNTNRNVLDSRDYFEISSKLQRILNKIEHKCNYQKLRKGFSFLMRNALTAAKSQETAAKSQQDAIKNELRRSTKVADMVRRGNYNILQKKIDELANRLEEEQALVEMANNSRRRRSMMLKSEQQENNYYHYQQQQQQHPQQQQPQQFHAPPPAPQHQSQNVNMPPPPPQTSNTASQQQQQQPPQSTSYTDNMNVNVNPDPKHYQQYMNKTTFYGDKENSKTNVEVLQVKSEVDDVGYKTAIETFETILNENVRDPNHHAALNNLKTLLHIDANNNKDTRPKTKINHLKNVTNKYNNRKYQTPKEQFEIPQDFDALLEAMHITSVRRRVIKETTDPDMIKWNVRYIKKKGKSEEEDGEDNNAKNENAIVVREVNEVVTGRDEVEN